MLWKPTDLIALKKSSTACKWQSSKDSAHHQGYINTHTHTQLHNGEDSGGVQRLAIIETMQPINIVQMSIIGHDRNVVCQKPKCKSANQ